MTAAILTNDARIRVLRKVFFIIALALSVMIVLLELGALAVLGDAGEQASSVSALVPGDSDLQDVLASLDEEQRQELNELLSQQKPPGIGISYLALLDGILLFTIALIALSDIISRRAHARVQGLATLVFSLFIIITGIVLAFIALALVILMVALLLAFPFGTLAYLARYGFFNTGGAAAALSLLMTLKLFMAGSLAVTNLRYFQNLGLVLLIVTSLVATIVIEFLHALPPGFLVSIADGIGAIIVAILAIIWAVILLIGSIPSVIRALQVNRV